MRRVIALLCLVLGTVPLLLGTAAAAVVGPDDRADLRPLAAPAGVRAVVVPHDLVPLSGVTLHVEAHADRGDVLVGAAHPVDVASYVSTTRRFVVLRAGTDGRPAGEVRGRMDDAPGDLTSATFWAADDRGAGTRELDVVLTDDPVAVTAVAAEPGARLDVVVGVEVASAFLVATATAVTGGALVAVGIFLLRRRGPQGSPGGVGSDEVSASGRGVVGRSRIAAAAHVARRSRVTGLASVVAVATAMSVTGCVARPGVAIRPSEPERLAVTDTERDAPDPSPHPYSVAAAAAAAGDPAAWAAVLSGPELEAQQFETRVELARAAQDGTPVDGSTYGLTTLEELNPSFARYPLFHVEVTRKEGDATAPPLLRLSERRDVLDGWHVLAETTVTEGTVLHRGDQDAPHAPQEADLARAQDGLAAVQHYVRTGETGPIAELGALDDVRSDLLLGDLGAVVQSVTVDPWGDRADPFGPGGASRTFAVEGGSVAVLSLDADVTISSMSADDPLRFVDPVVADLVGQPGWRTALRVRAVVIVAVAVSSSGSVTVLGASAKPVDGA
ncbi:hypothetical protein ACFO3K_05890 [Cellulomonas algicola]|uniref:hypothetical protein n=1 Tax=Cellulomonas algicola TaxID=2071633 RepID=UPI001C3F5512|nr:hypothetical protein [Cellulomonas algicola]